MRPVFTAKRKPFPRYHYIGSWQLIRLQCMAMPKEDTTDKPKLQLVHHAR